MMRRFRKFFVCAASSLLVLCGSCSDVVVPKPRGYFRITLPDHDYTRFCRTDAPFSFDHSTLSRVVTERKIGSNEEWLNIDYPSLNCKIHVTYLKLSKEQEDMAYEDNHRLLFKHTVAADAIVSQYFDDESKKVHAAIFTLKGNAATPAQFSITDSLGQVFRGSLYFFCHPNKDSLAPVVEYVDADLNRLIESFRWED